MTARELQTGDRFRVKPHQTVFTVLAQYPGREPRAHLTECRFVSEYTGEQQTTFGGDCTVEPIREIPVVLPACNQPPTEQSPG